MPMNKIQFQPGLSMPEFIQQYGTEAQCEETLVQRPAIMTNYFINIWYPIEI